MEKTSSDSRTFFTALTILKKNSSIIIKNVGLNPTRIGFYKLLKQQGANIKFKNIKKKNHEIIGDILVNSCKLKPLKASKKFYVNTTDEYPILFVMAALTKGVSTFNGIEELTNKESNRVSEMQKILSKIGVKSIYKNNQLKIFGKGLLEVKNCNIRVLTLVIIVFVCRLLY